MIFQQLLLQVQIVRVDFENSTVIDPFVPILVPALVMNKVFVLIFFLDFDALGLVEKWSVIATKTSNGSKWVDNGDALFKTYRSFSPSENILVLGFEGIVLLLDI